MLGQRRWHLIGCVWLAASGAQAWGIGDAALQHQAPTRQLAQHVLAQVDHGLRPFAIVDKRSATITVFDVDGRQAGQSAVLLGSAVGDHSVPGVGQRTQQGTLRAEDRTTPAGRFVAEPGRNLSGEAVLWLDYGSALAIHRLRSGPSQPSRALRLAADDVALRRVSAGCVVVPGWFFDTVVQPLLGSQRGTVYVLPEQGGAWPLPPRQLLAVRDEARLTAR